MTTAIKPALNYTVHDGVRNVVSIQIPGWKTMTEPGWLFTVLAIHGDTVTLFRDNPQATFDVPAEQVTQAYRVTNGTYYDRRTPHVVVDVLERVRRDETRVRIHYGDIETGRDWLQEWGMTGTISRSMGPHKIPLLISNRRSQGGGGLLDGCIVKITTTTQPRQVLYQHPKYHYGEIVVREITPEQMTMMRSGELPKSLRELGYTHAVDVGGENHANFTSLASATRWLEKMNLKEE